MSLPIAFDFDKTLTYKDTVLDFYLMAAKATGKYSGLKLVRYFVAMVLHKLRRISNDNLKERGIALFLKGISKEELQGICVQYGKTIALNKVYPDSFLPAKEPRVIISASYEEYLKPLFPNDTVIAAALSYQEGKVAGLARNCYSRQKVAALAAAGITRLAAFYTDSNSDAPVMELAECVYWVEGDFVKKIK